MSNQPFPSQRRIAGILFVAALFGVIVLWGYIPSLWIRSWPQLTLLGIAVASLIAWFVLSIHSFSLWIKKRSTQFAIGLAVTAAALLGILGTVNWIVVKNNQKWDLTYNKFYTMSDQTKNVLKGLKEDVSIRVWTSSIERLATNIDLRKVLDDYARLSNGRVKVEIRSPVNDPIESKKDNLKRDNVIIVRASSGRESRIESFNDTKGEEQITNAIMKTLRGTKKTICFIAGHGEASPTSSEPMGLSTVSGALVDAGYQTKEISLAMDQNGVPAECEVVALTGPQGAPTAKELTMLQEYLDRGGHMVALLGITAAHEWKNFLAKRYGVEIKNDVILEPKNNPPIGIATNNYAQDVEIVKGYNRFAVFIEVASINISSKKEVENAVAKTFISSTPYTYAKAGNIKDIKNVLPTKNDVRGPHPIAVLVTATVGDVTTTPSTKPSEVKKPKATIKPAPKAEPKTGALSWLSNAYAEASDVDNDPPAADKAATVAGENGPKDQKKETQIVVFSSESFAMNGVVNQAGNRDLFLNTIAYLAKDQDFIGIRPREIRQATLDLTDDALRKVYATVFLVALAFIMGGIFAGHRRSVSV